MNKMPDHFFGDVKMGDHAVLHGPDGIDASGSPSQHLFGFLAYSLDFFGVCVDGHH